MKYTILMPCLNEEETLEICINKASACIAKHTLNAEVLIADNGSHDQSVTLAKQCGARVIHVKTKGYGAALREGIKAAKGEYVIMADADDSYDFQALDCFVNELEKGYDIVMGNRFEGGIKKGAMPFLHQYIGNPLLSYIGKLFYQVPCNDFHCGYRGFNKESISNLNLNCSGMEFASEMVIKAKLFNLTFKEIPVSLSPDGRSRPPHLKTFQDGFRHLRLMILFNPAVILKFPGIALLVTGLGLFIPLILQPYVLFNIKFDFHTLLYAACFIIIGLQLLLFNRYIYGLCTKKGWLPVHMQSKRMISPLIGFFCAIFLVCIGLVLGGGAVAIWYTTGFQELDASLVLRLVIPSIVAIISGVQILLYFLLSSLLEYELDS